jgi:Fe-S cluster biogenesis protein NfuA
MASVVDTPTVTERVESSLAKIRPQLQAHGGDVELVNVSDEGIVSVKLAGACHGCPGALMTLRMGIERLLKEEVPEVTRVEAVSPEPAPAWRGPEA